jgi:hypothetical protein
LEIEYLRNSIYYKKHINAPPMASCGESFNA